MRAKTLRRMTDSSYLTAVKALSARGWRRLEPVPLGPPDTQHACATSPGLTATASAKPCHGMSSPPSPARTHHDSPGVGNDQPDARHR